MKYVNQPVRKKDAMQLVTGQPVYVDDIAPKDCLIVKLLRSPYANAMVTSVNKAAAMKVDGILYMGGYPTGRKKIYSGRSDLPGAEPV